MKKLLLLLVLFVSALANVMAQEVYAYKMTKNIDANGVLCPIDNKVVAYRAFTANGNIVYTCDASGVAGQLSHQYKYQYTRNNCRYYRCDLGYGTKMYYVLVVSPDKKILNQLTYFDGKSEPHSTAVYKRVEPQDTNLLIPGLIQ